MEQIVFLDDVECAKYQELLEPLQRFGGLTVYTTVPKNNRELLERVHDATVVCFGLSHFTKEVLSACPDLKLLCFLGTGVWDYVDLEAANKLRIAVMNVADYGINAVAEHVLALMLAVNRHICEAHQRVLWGIWDQSGLAGVELAGSTLGIVGLGRIGRRVAEIGLQLGMRVCGYDNVPPQQWPGFQQIEFMSLRNVVRTADYLTIHLPGLPETQNVVNADVLKLLKKDAVVINTSRGEVLDNEFLAHLLRTGRIRGAGLDVFPTEPPGNDNPYLGLTNVVLTPHIGFATRNAIQRLLQTAVQQIADFLVDEQRVVVNAQEEESINN